MRAEIRDLYIWGRDLTKGFFAYWIILKKYVDNPRIQPKSFIVSF